jgi:hypothetical protein
LLEENVLVAPDSRLKTTVVYEWRASVLIVVAFPQTCTVRKYDFEGAPTAQEVLAKISEDPTYQHGMLLKENVLVAPDSRLKTTVVYEWRASVAIMFYLVKTSQILEEQFAYPPAGDEVRGHLQATHELSAIEIWDGSHLVEGDEHLDPTKVYYIKEGMRDTNGHKEEAQPN